MKNRCFVLLFALLTVSVLCINAEQITPAPTVSLENRAIEANLLYLVNKDNKLPADYEPSDLVLPKVKTRKKSLQDKIYLRQEAAIKLEEMFRAAETEAGYKLLAVSGYRSYGIQQLNFNRKMEEVGDYDRASRSVMPAGYSEHQLGLTMDIQSDNFKNLNAAFAETEEGIWLAENAHRFGYILRYKPEWKDITGIAFEPWHYRYVGIAHAGAIHMLDIPLETYLQYISLLPPYVVSGGCDILLAGLVRDLQVGNRQVLAQFSGFSGDTYQVLKTATQPYLPQGLSFDEAQGRCYPTPMPTSAPRVDEDEEVSLFSSP